MKLISAALISILTLTSCGSSTPTKVAKGEVISCTTIATDTSKTSGTTLSCLDGNSKVLLESITGPAVINVWGSWCIPCRQEMPFLRELAATGKVKIIGIDVEEANMESARKFVIEQGMSWPNLYDVDGSTKSSFGMGVPVTWYLNSKSEVAYKHIGVLKSKDQLFSDVEKYLGINL
ncbi:TrxA Thiol-disulfide isomerase and thioredoxins [actinobacterium SCGC AAA044-D11]